MPNSLKTTLLGVLFLLFLCFSVSAAEGIVTVKPRESDALLANPGMGWETFHRFADEDPNLAGLPSSTAYFRWYWYQVEPEKDEINWELFDETLRKAHKAGQKLAFRIMCCGTGSRYHYSPKWLKEQGYAGFEYSRGDGPKHWAPDLDDPEVLEEHLELIRAIGRRYDGHPDVAHVDLGSVGLWGEWHMSGTGHENPSHVTCRRIIDTYLESFQETPMVMLIGPLEELKYATSKGTGWRADCLGDMGGFSDGWCHMRDFYPQQIKRAGITDTWKTAPVAFETCWDMRKWKKEGWDIERIFNWALAQHASYINNKSAPLPEGTRSQVERLLRKLGYRFVLRSLKHPAAVEPGGTLSVEMKWENVGVAPCYADYKPAVRLVGRDGKPRCTELCEGTVRDWLPGTFTNKKAIDLPDDLKPGEYSLQVAIVRPDTKEPVVKLAIEGRGDDGWYPLSEVTVR